MTSFALSPSGPCEGESVIEPSAPVNTFEFAMFPPLLKNQSDSDEIDAERRSENRVDNRPAVNFVIAAGTHIQRETDQGLILHHGGEKSVDRSSQSCAYALIVQTSDERVARLADSRLGEIDDTPGSYLLERSVVGGQAANHSDVASLFQHHH